MRFETVGSDDGVELRALEIDLPTADVPRGTMLRAFHVEQYGGPGSSRFEELHPDQGEVLAGWIFLVPTKSRRLNECGTGMGSRQSQVCIFWTSCRSLVPIQRITCFAATFSECAHSRKGPNSPSAREQTKSSGATSSASSS